MKRWPISPPTSRDLETSALFIKGRTTHHATDGSVSHFHLQVTAAGCKGPGTNCEAELRREIPDVDTLDNSRSADDDHVVITFRGVGELQPHNPANRVTLSEDADEFGMRRAFVSLGDPGDPAQPGETIQTTNDRVTWDAMDALADDVRARHRRDVDERRPRPLPRRPGHDPPRGRDAVDGHRPRRDP